MMTLTPQSMRSPVSPYNQHSNRSFSSQRPCYPTTPQPESSALEMPQSRGLGLYACPIAQSQSNIHALPPSPQPSDSWSHSSMMEQDFPQSSQPPDIFTAAFDPFSGFSATAASHTGMISGQLPETPGLDCCPTPRSTNLPSHRSSVSSSYAPTEAYSHNGSPFIYTPEVKIEDTNDWYSSASNKPILQKALTTQGLSPYSTGVSPASAPGVDLYRTRAEIWSKPATPGYPIDLHSTDDRLPTPTLPSVIRTKKKRQRTTPEEATHECRVCGKLFKRSYNWKSHMETHNPDRKYPHPCTAVIGSTSCTKKFQRKTDLDRHYDSVHLKARNHRCNLCGNRFARRDTLRRHTEDGCPKRYELGFREGSAATPARWSLTNFPGRSRSYSLSVQPASPVAPPSLPVSTTSNFPDYSRSGYVTSLASEPATYASC